jgi:hypothetical protein
VSLDVEGQGGSEFFSLVQHDELRLPAGLRRGAAGFVQGVQEGIGEERIRAGLPGYQPIPGRLADIEQRGSDMRAIIQDDFRIMKS